MGSCTYLYLLNGMAYTYQYNTLSSFTACLWPVNHVMVESALRIPPASFKPFRKILRVAGKTIHDYRLIEKNDRILVAVSGGKDSLVMLSILLALQAKSPVPFEIFAYTVDQGQPQFQTGGLAAHFSALKIEHYIEKHDTYSIVTEKLDEGQTPCFLCSRLRRGILYSEAKRLGANKIALGHHLDDAAETLLMNLFYNGRNASIPPVLHSDDRQNIVIRPLIEVEEKWLRETAEYLKMPVIPCYTCDSGENMQRQRIKKLLQAEEEKNPHVKSSIRHALKNVQTRHLWSFGE